MKEIVNIIIATGLGVIIGLYMKSLSDAANFDDLMVDNLEEQ